MAKAGEWGIPRLLCGETVHRVFPDKMLARVKGAVEAFVLRKVMESWGYESEFFYSLQSLIKLWVLYHGVYSLPSLRGSILSCK